MFYARPLFNLSLWYPFQNKEFILVYNQFYRSKFTLTYFDSWFAKYYFFFSFNYGALEAILLLLILLSNILYKKRTITEGIVKVRSWSFPLFFIFPTSSVRHTEQFGRISLARTHCQWRTLFIHRPIPLRSKASCSLLTNLWLIRCWGWKRV